MTTFYTYPEPTPGKPTWCGHSAKRSPRWWCIYITPTPLAWNGWSLMDELFSLAIRPLLNATAAIEQVVLASPVVCSDETSVRVKGKNWWEWVFIGTLAVLHVIQPSRGNGRGRAAVLPGVSITLSALSVAVAVLIMAPRIAWN